MPTVFDQLHQDHINYSRLLNLLEINLQRMMTEEKADYLIMQDIMKYMIDYPDIRHHPAEEHLFGELNYIEEKDAAYIERLCEEHKLLTDLAQQLWDQLKKANSGQIVSKDKILELGNRYIDTYREHINVEEREIFPLLEANITQEVLNKAEQQLNELTDPLFSDAISDEYQNLFNAITERNTND